MARLTITLPDELQRALKEAAAQRGTTMGSLIQESLAHYGIKPRERAQALVARARKMSKLSAAQALELALKETQAQRRR
ncbi:MAG TPA: ribbon-helix-helix protein, CopG family [Acidobacteriota bacterium]|jgi:predicted transcriptional regulator